MSQTAVRTLKSDFSITIDFNKGSDNPARIFQTMTDLISAFQKFDSRLIKGLDGQLEPAILLEDIEKGSLRTWLSQTLKGIPDEGLKDADWKKVLGHYLVKCKYIILNKLDGKTNITDAVILEDIQNELVEEAKKTDVKFFPYYQPIALPKLIKSIDEINNSLKHLSDKDKAHFESKLTKKANFNLELNFSPDTIEDLLVKESLSNTSIMILKVKKPDYLGNSMWEFRHSNKNMPAKIIDDDWLLRFQQRKIDIRPGDSIKADVNIIVKYGHDNNVIATNYEVKKVIDVLPLINPNENQLF